MYKTAVLFVHVRVCMLIVSVYFWVIMTLTFETYGKHRILLLTKFFWLFFRWQRYDFLAICKASGFDHLTQVLHTATIANAMLPSV